MEASLRELTHRGNSPLRVVIINRSDLRGGAAVVSKRLMDSLRAEGVDASMLVEEKLSDSPYVVTTRRKAAEKFSFLMERLRIFLANGYSRKNLFQVDIATDGLPLSEYDVVKNADVVVLGWVNQGMVSLKEIGRLLRMGKKVFWVMHDMWNMTGVCHHAGECVGYLKECDNCPLLGMGSSDKDLSRFIWKRKKDLYSGKGIHFVAVSNWLAGKAAESGLLSDQRVSVINNPFLPEEMYIHRELRDKPEDKIRIIFGAARIDDPVKGLSRLKSMTHHFAKKYPAYAKKSELVIFGNAKQQESLLGFGIPVDWLGSVNAERIPEIYSSGDVVVSSSLYETLPGTLVEGLAFGAVPVCFRRGGQPDIVDHMKTGFIADFNEDVELSGEALADGVAWAIDRLFAEGHSFREKLRESVTMKFSPRKIAHSYLKLFREGD